MDLIKKSYTSAEKIPTKLKKEFSSVMDKCFPNIFFDSSDLLSALKIYNTKIDLFYSNENVLLGFICHSKLDEDNVSINYLGVNQEKRKYTEKGIATYILSDFIKNNPNTTVNLICNCINDRARYLYHKFNFDIKSIYNSAVGLKQYHMVLNTNKEYNAIASIIYEIYKHSQKNELSIEESFFDIYNNKKFDNLYQYNINEKDIEETILNSSLFAQCLSILDHSYNKKSKNTFPRIIKELKSLDTNNYIAKSTKHNVKLSKHKELEKIFEAISIKEYDDIVSSNISSKR